MAHKEITPMPLTQAALFEEYFKRYEHSLSLNVISVEAKVLRETHNELFARITFYFDDGTSAHIDTTEFGDSVPIHVH